MEERRLLGKISSICHGARSESASFTRLSGIDEAGRKRRRDPIGTPRYFSLSPSSSVLIGFPSIQRRADASTLPLVKVIAAHLAPFNRSPKVEVTELGGEGGL
jgi:hypothetical protein